MQKPCHRFGKQNYLDVDKKSSLWPKLYEIVVYKTSNIFQATAAKKGKGQRSTYKIKFGWQNFREGKYRVVTKAKGGGESYMLHDTFRETLTVERIRNQALVYLISDGISNLGSVKEYDFSLALTYGKVTDSFIDKKKSQNEVLKKLISKLHTDIDNKSNK